MWEDLLVLVAMAVVYQVRGCQGRRVGCRTCFVFPWLTACVCTQLMFYIVLRYKYRMRVV